VTMKTNSKIRLSAAKARRIYVVIALILFPFLASEKAFAQTVNGYLFQSGTGFTTFDIDRTTTSTFQLDLNIMVPFNSVSISYWYQTGANGSGLFSITSRTTTGSPYQDNTTSDGQAFLPANALLDPVTGTPAQPSDLGATCNTCPVTGGQHFISRFTFSISPDIPIGTYTIFLDYRGTVWDDLKQDHPIVANVVTIHIVGTPPALSLGAAASRKVHGSAGTFDVDLPLTGEPGVECRNTGGDYTLVFTFNNTVVSGSAMITSGIGSVAGSPTFGSHTMTVELTGVPDVQQVTVTLTNVMDGFGQTLPDTPVSVNMLIGDVTGNRAVNASDIWRIKSQTGSQVTSANFRTDINASGTVTASDVAQGKMNSGHTLP
jgi:hypothetical protein